MASGKKAYVAIFGFSTYLYQDMVECVNIASWNPGLAIERMEEIKLRLSSSILEEAWNKYAKEINYILVTKPNYRWYSEQEYWADPTYKSIMPKNTKPRLLKVS